MTHHWPSVLMHTTFSLTDRVITMGSVFYGSGGGHVFDIDCSGTENSVLECDIKAASDTSRCTHSNDVGLACIGIHIMQKQY